MFDWIYTNHQGSSPVLFSFAISALHLSFQAPSQRTNTGNTKDPIHHDEKTTVIGLVLRAGPPGSGSRA